MTKIIICDAYTRTRCRKHATRRMEILPRNHTKTAIIYRCDAHAERLKDKVNCGAAFEIVKDEIVKRAE